MITSLRLVDFKNFADETLRVGPFTVIVGSNASGKSNIRDAFRFLHGIGRGYTLAEIIGGRYGAGGQVEWEPIRGATNEIIRIEKSTNRIPRPPLPAFGLEVGLTADNKDATYTVEVSREITRTTGFRITYERLQLGQETVFEKQRSVYGGRKVVVGDSNELKIALDRPALTQIRDMRRVHESAKERVEPIIDALSSMRFLDPAPDRMRLTAYPSQTVLGDRGENLPAVLNDIYTDPERRKLLTSWTRELTPMDVSSFEFPIDHYDDRIRLFIQEKNGRKVSAHSASDGTLRFLTLLAAMFGTDPARLYFFEEMDTGIHPARLWLLLRLIEKQTAKGGTQVITTSHSPDMLTFAGDTTFENISVVCRLEDSHDAIIRPVADLPNARKLRKTQGLGRLLASGWMETAVAFTEGDGDDEEDSG